MHSQFEIEKCNVPIWLIINDSRRLVEQCFDIRILMGISFIDPGDLVSVKRSASGSGHVTEYESL